ncbi:MAG TPA: 3-oxoacyl-ACP synthase [Crocinitomix sp.]|nr:3-oxoacyl-ACP synthase [Crocinitomix sp.]
MDKFKVKHQLFEFCVSQIQQKIDRIQSVMNDAQESANHETKSTAGDKHDTARAMAHLETEKNAKQLAEIIKIKKVLPYLKSKKGIIVDDIQLGSVVETSNGCYYISANLGVVVIDGLSFITLSPISPLGTILLNTNKKAVINFNGISIKIQKIY